MLQMLCNGVFRVLYRGFVGADAPPQNVSSYLQTGQSSPSTVIQARIEFDALCAMELADMSPHKLRALSEHKRDLIFELSRPPQTRALPVCN